MVMHRQKIVMWDVKQGYTMCKCVGYICIYVYVWYLQLNMIVKNMRVNSGKKVNIVLFHFVLSYIGIVAFLHNVNG